LKNYISTILLFCLIQTISFAQLNTLRQDIDQIIATKNASIGIGIYDLQNGDTFYINGDAHLPMQSVFKLHIALAVLDQVDKGKFKLKQKIAIKRSEILLDTWSPMQEDNPTGDIALPLADILQYMVSKSDNNACDILLDRIGGTKTVDDYIHSLGISDFSIKANEAEMHKAWDVQYTNWTTMKATIALLKKCYDRAILSKKSHTFLWKIMVETTTGLNRIVKKLPKGTVVGHKTGTSGTNADGMFGAINDIGIVVMPNGQRFAMSAFVANSKENMETNEQVIADIAKLAGDYFMKKTK
jgi:beta-lactamase class A